MDKSSDFLFARDFLLFFIFILLCISTLSTVKQKKSQEYSGPCAQIFGWNTSRIHQNNVPNGIQQKSQREKNTFIKFITFRKVEQSWQMKRVCVREPFVICCACVYAWVNFREIRL